jgi:hypothetical protein
MPRAQQSAPSPDFAVSNWKPFEKNTLRGFLTLTLPSGLILHNCTFHRKGDSRWLGLPAQRFTKPDGTTSYTPQVEFVDRAASDRFQTAALQAIDRYLGSGGGAA